MQKKKSVRWLLSLVSAAMVPGMFCTLAPARAEEPKQTPRERGRVIYNLDCSEFFVGTFGPLVPETLDAFVDAHAAAGISDLFINVNAQRTNYRGTAWESDWDGYDPDAGDDQPFFAGIDPKRIFETQFYKNVRALHLQGCDYPQRMLARARHNKIGAWLSVRMNDSHYPDRPAHPYHSSFWRAHPEWHLSNKALDFEQPEVRKHTLALIRELCDRYDSDGIELDFLRFWLYFRPGREHQGVPLMTDLVRQARLATEKAAERLGHPVRLAVRVPADPWIARRHGLDAVDWAREGLVDLVIAGSFWSSTNSDIPVETWKGLLDGSGVEVAIHLEDGVNSGDSGRRTMTHEEMRGILASGLDRGADAVYFFNLFTGPYQRWPRADHDRLLTDAGSYKALSAAPRRHVLTLISPWSTGHPGKPSLLPYSGRQGIFRLHTGPRPSDGQQARVELVVPDHDEPLTVSVNGIACSWLKLGEPDHIKASGWKEVQPPRHLYSIPPGAMGDGYNVIEVVASEQVKLSWVEISIE